MTPPNVPVSLNTSGTARNARDTQRVPHPIDTDQGYIPCFCPQTARWIRNVVLKYPGILYDELTAASRLGMDIDSFRRTSMQTLFMPARYDGIFADFAPRWWRDRMFRIAQDVASQVQDGTLARRFAQAFEAKYHEAVAPASCIFDGTPVADWVCYILQQPMKLRNSIPYYPDARPSVMDQARVSFKAITESEEFDETLVDADSLTVVQDLWRQPTR